MVAPTLTALDLEKIGVVGLGYVGLPVALSMARKFHTVGFDVSDNRVAQLNSGIDVTGQITTAELGACGVTFSTDATVLTGCTFVIVAVPTPVDAQKRPDLSHLIKASEAVGAHLARGTVVVYESTVYPGATEEVCGPILEKTSGLKAGKDFYLGYSPERVNPGDREHSFERIKKVVAAQDTATLERVVRVYQAVVAAGVHEAPNIRVAEAAKLIENTQRDLNIALMNELALICDRIGVRSRDVLAAAATKWNFLPFSPGLVGGDCVGVAPYYLATKAESLGYVPEVMLAARRVNDAVAVFVARKVIDFLTERGANVAQSKVAILGLTFKENVPEVRGSKVPDVVDALSAHGVSTLIHDPLANAQSAAREFGFRLCNWDEVQGVDVLVYAVAHRVYEALDLTSCVKPGGLLIDIKSRLSPNAVIVSGVRYWSL